MLRNLIENKKLHITRFFQLYDDIFLRWSKPCHHFRICLQNTFYSVDNTSHTQWNLQYERHSIVRHMLDDLCNIGRAFSIFEFLMEAVQEKAQHLLMFEDD